MQAERDKVAILSKILDLRNANSMGIRNENVRRIMDTFGREPGDTGSPEVQAAILTYRIHVVADALAENPRDVYNRRWLRHLISRRASQLRYLKRTSLQRYSELLPRMGVHPLAVEGELIYRIEGTGVPKLDPYARR